MPVTFYSDAVDIVTINSPGPHTVILLGGNDVLTVHSGTVDAAMGEGDDVASLRGGTTSVYGESGADRFEIYAAATAFGGGDNDLFNIRGGSNIVADGGTGDDRFNFYGAAGSVLLHGGAGNDDFFGYNHAITGSIHGDAGEDYFILFRSGVTIYGGSGNDIYRADAVAPANFVELADEGVDSVQVARGASFTMPDNIERISVQGFSGSTDGAAGLIGNASDNTITAHNNEDTIFGHDGNDRLFGKGARDYIDGGNGNDYLDGGPGNDALIGQAGNDTLNGRAGDDEMIGGLGDDVFYVDSVADTVSELAEEGTDLVRTTVSYVLSDNVENGIIGGSEGLWLQGNELANELTGNSGANELRGWGGNDVIRGGGGDDEIWESTGDDWLSGGDGNDWIYGAQGTDTLTGGTGDDTFFFFAIGDSAPGAADQIVDMVSGADIIDLSSIDADVNTVGDQAFTFNFSGVPVGAAGDMWYTYTTDGAAYDWIFYGDVNGDSIADFEIHIHSAGNMFPGDFIV